MGYARSTLYETFMQNSTHASVGDILTCALRAHAHAHAADKKIVIRVVHHRRRRRRRCRRRGRGRHPASQQQRPHLFARPLFSIPRSLCVLLWTLAVRGAKPVRYVLSAKLFAHTLLAAHCCCCRHVATRAGRALAQEKVNKFKKYTLNYSRLCHGFG